MQWASTHRDPSSCSSPPSLSPQHSSKCWRSLCFTHRDAADGLVSACWFLKWSNHLYSRSQHTRQSTRPADATCVSNCCILFHRPGQIDRPTQTRQRKRHTDTPGHPQSPPQAHTHTLIAGLYSEQIASHLFSPTTLIHDSSLCSLLTGLPTFPTPRATVTTR